MQRKVNPSYQMLVLQINSQPNNQPIRICSELSQSFHNLLSVGYYPFASSTQLEKETESFSEDIQKLSKKISSQKLSNIYLYTNNDVFFGELKSENLNKELHWMKNTKFLKNLKQCISGKNSNTVVTFIQENYNPVLTLSCDLEDKSMRIMFFQLQMVCLHCSPFQHAKQLLTNVDRRLFYKSKQLQTQQIICKTQIDRAQSLMAEIKDSYQFEINHMQNSFISVINQIKKKTRPFYEQGKEVMQIDSNQDKDSATQSRKLIKIKKNSSNDLRDSENFQKLFKKQ